MTRENPLIDDPDEHLQHEHVPQEHPVGHRSQAAHPGIAHDGCEGPAGMWPDRRGGEEQPAARAYETCLNRAWLTVGGVRSYGPAIRAVDTQSTAAPAAKQAPGARATSTMPTAQRGSGSPALTKE